MIQLALRPWNEKALHALETLPAIDPLTLVHRRDQTSDDTQPARRALTAALANAPNEIRHRLEHEYFGNGPLDPLLQDPSITEIIINGADSIWFEKAGQLARHDDVFLSALTYRNFVERMCREAGVQASLDLPFADGSWGACRVHLVISPLTRQPAVVTLRKHPLSAWTFARLQELEWASAPALAQLRKLVESRANFLVIGNTGSGKTSVLNACLQAVRENERAVMIEDTSELRAPNDVSVNLLTRRDPHGHLREVNQSELLKQALRMRPDRLIMGEIRGGEAKDLLMAFATGHTGCMGTLHADSARQALIRLEMLIQLGAPQWNLHAVRTLILLSLQNVVVVKRAADGRRFLAGIYKLTSLEDVGFLIEKLT